MKLCLLIDSLSPRLNITNLYLQHNPNKKKKWFSTLNRHPTNFIKAVTQNSLQPEFILESVTHELMPNPLINPSHAASPIGALKL